MSSGVSSQAPKISKISLSDLENAKKLFHDKYPQSKDLFDMIEGDSTDFEEDHSNEVPPTALTAAMMLFSLQHKFLELNSLAPPKVFVEDIEPKASLEAMTGTEAAFVSAFAPWTESYSKRNRVSTRVAFWCALDDPNRESVRRTLEMYALTDEEKGKLSKQVELILQRDHGPDPWENWTNRPKLRHLYGESALSLLAATLDEGYYLV